MHNDLTRTSCVTTNKQVYISNKLKRVQLCFGFYTSQKQKPFEGSFLPLFVQIPNHVFLFSCSFQIATTQENKLYETVLFYDEATKREILYLWEMCSYASLLAQPYCF